LIRMSIPATDRGRSRRAPTDHRPQRSNGAAAATPRYHQGDNRKHQARGDRKPPRGSAQQPRHLERAATGNGIGAIAFMQPRRGSRRRFGSHASQRAQ